MELIKAAGDNLVFRVKDGVVIDDAELSNVDLGGKVKRVTAVFERVDVPEGNLFTVSPEIFDIRIVYSLNKESLPSYTEIIAGGEVRLEPPVDLGGLKSFFMETIEKHYISRFPGLVPPGLRQDTKNFVDKQLKLEGNVYVVAGNKRVGFASLVDSKNVFGKPVDLIPWVWVEEQLGKNTRNLVHKSIAHWLKANAKGEINAWVDSFNIRSIRFFRKLGFLPFCAHFFKR